MHNVFDNGREKAHIMFEGKIGALAIGRIFGTDAFGCLIGCADRHIRAVYGDEEVVDVTVAGRVSALVRYSDDEEHAVFIYGTENGIVGEIAVGCGKEPELGRGWSISGESAVNCLVVHDITKDGLPDIIVGRENGHVEVYSFDMGTSTPVMQFSESVDSSVRCIAVGTLTTPGYEEIVVCTYSGNIISFTTESLEEKDEEDDQGRTKAEVTKEAQISQMQRELSELESKIEASRNELEMESPQHNRSSGRNHLATAHAFNVNYRFELNAEIGAYNVTCEIPVPIELVAIQSTFSRLIS